MGGPTSAIVSEIYMQSLQTTAITTAEHPPNIWERHDVFSIVHKIYVQELLEHISNLHPQTQFTKEEENTSILPFLDTLVQRHHDKTISVKIYRKLTYTNQYLKYTIQHLQNKVYSLLYLTKQKRTKLKKASDLSSITAKWLSK